MRYPDARNVPGAIYRSSDVTGPLAPPGTYQVRLTVGEHTTTQPFILQKDPRVTKGDDDLHTQFAFLIEVRDRLSEVNDAINKLRRIREEAQGWETRASGHAGSAPITEAVKTLVDGLSEIEAELIQTRWKSSRDALTAPSKLNVRLATLMGIASGADAAPTAQAREVFTSVSTRVGEQLARLNALLTREVPRFNALVRAQELPALTVPGAGDSA